MMTANPWGECEFPHHVECLFDFDQWIHQHGLSSIKQVFVDFAMCAPQSLQFQNPQFSKLLADHRIVSCPDLIPRIISAVQSLQENQANVSPHPSNPQHSHHPTRSLHTVSSHQHQSSPSLPPRSSLRSLFPNPENDALLEIKQLIANMHSLRDSFASIGEQYKLKKSQNQQQIVNYIHCNSECLSKQHQNITESFTVLFNLLEVKELSMRTKIEEYTKRFNRFHVDHCTVTNALDGTLKESEMTIQNDLSHMKEQEMYCAEILRDHTQNNDRSSGQILDICNRIRKLYDETLAFIRKNQEEVQQFVASDITFDVDLDSIHERKHDIYWVDLDQKVFDEMQHHITRFIDIFCVDEREFEEAINAKKERSKSIAEIEGAAASPVDSVKSPKPSTTKKKMKLKMSHFVTRGHLRSAPSKKISTRSVATETEIEYKVDIPEMEESSESASNSPSPSPSPSPKSGNEGYEGSEGTEDSKESKPMVITEGDEIEEKTPETAAVREEAASAITETADKMTMTENEANDSNSPQQQGNGKKGKKGKKKQEQNKKMKSEVNKLRNRLKTMEKSMSTLRKSKEILITDERALQESRDQIKELKKQLRMEQRKNEQHQRTQSKVKAQLVCSNVMCSKAHYIDQWDIKHTDIGRWKCLTGKRQIRGIWSAPKGVCQKRGWFAFLDFEGRNATKGIWCCSIKRDRPTVVGGGQGYIPGHIASPVCIGISNYRNHPGVKKGVECGKRWPDWAHSSRFDGSAMPPYWYINEVVTVKVDMDNRVVYYFKDHQLIQKDDLGMQGPVYVMLSGAAIAHARFNYTIVNPEDRGNESDSDSEPDIECAASAAT